MPVCKICDIVRADLNRHIKKEHGLTAMKYRLLYGSPVVDSSVEEKRKLTCLLKYGNPNYRNEEARKLANEVYENGHSLRDPLIREKARKTKQELYGDPNFTNREKAKVTCLKKYGVENVNQLDSVVKKRVQTCIERYGRVINYDRPDTFTKDELINLHVNQKKTLKEIGKGRGLCSETVKGWMKRHGIKTIRWTRRYVCGPYSGSKTSFNEYDFKKAQELFLQNCAERGVARNSYKDGILGIPTRIIECRCGSWNNFIRLCGLKPCYTAHQPIKHVQDYLSACKTAGKVLSFYEFEKITGHPATRLKRLFNAGKPYHHLIEELKLIAVDESLWPDFLGKLESYSESFPANRA